MKRVYMCCQAPCTSTEHIIVWLNQLGLDGWLMCGRHGGVRRGITPPSFYFTRGEYKHEPI